MAPGTLYPPTARRWHRWRADNIAPYTRAPYTRPRAAGTRWRGTEYPAPLAAGTAGRWPLAAGRWPLAPLAPLAAGRWPLAPLAAGMAR